MEPVKVGIREFREHLAQYLEGESPIAITRHGDTIGVYVPTRRKRPADEDVAAFRAAADRLDAMLEAAGVSGEELIEEVERAKRKVRQH